jgi:3-oxoacyl-[acyl-carrier protein] reductase
MFGQAFKSRVAVITASTSGIGQETARLLAQGGAETVIINGRNPDTGAKVLEQLSAAFPATNLRFNAGNLNVPEQSHALFDQIQREIARIDILVHCGGSQVRPEFFTRMNPMMAPGGSIVAIASDAGKVATPAETMIGAMKAAVIMFSRTLAMEVSRQGIRVNVVTPSLVANTVSYDRVMSGETSSKIFGKATAKAKLGLPTPKDVAPLAVFLSSPYASKITGQAVSVNGGISAA